MKRMAALVLMLVSLSTAVISDDSPTTQALGQFAWSLADALPSVACRGQDADLDAAATALLADPRMDVVRAWLEHVRLPLPPQAPPSDWPVARCMAAVQETRDLLDANVAHLERMAAQLSTGD
ncbi:MAG: hypothetical protein KF823_00420 [Xanthomonadales bacterium]|nr:hypothetical protein [Xanthomonadales bacterium]